MSSANFISGGIYEAKSNITHYFGLKKENQKLMDENIWLRDALEVYKDNYEPIQIDSSKFTSKYKFISSRVINNTYSKSKNLLTIGKGANHGVRIDMGVITSNGILGIVKIVSDNYATVQSILNTESQINARLKNSNHFGSLVWDTKEPNVVQLIEVNRIAPVKVGDTIVTGGKSTIFPDGLLIGTVKSLDIGKNDSYNLNIKLFNDMTNLKYVYLIENTEANEIKILEKEGEDE